MALSNKWNMTDNVYYRQPCVSPVCPEGVDKNVFEFSLGNNKRDTYLYNNRLFFGICNPKQSDKDQYNRNWKFINSLT